MSSYAKLPNDGDENRRPDIGRNAQENGGDWGVESPIQGTAYSPVEDEEAQNIRLEDIYVNNWHPDDFNEVQPAGSEKSAYRISERSGFPPLLGNLNQVETEIDLEPTRSEWGPWDWQPGSLSTGRRLMYRVSSLAKRILGVSSSDSWFEDRETSRYCGMISLLLLLAFVVLGLPVVLHKLSPEAPELPGKTFFDFHFDLSFLLLIGVAQETTSTSVLVTGAKGSVAADNPECSKIGIRVLRDMDGNAVDSAIATTLCQGVLNPFASTIGGGCFILIRLANGTEDFLDGREVAPSSSTKEMFLNSSTSVVGGKAVAVPGELKALELAHQLYGKVSWKSLVELSVELASSSKVGPLLAKRLKEYKDIIFESPSLRELFTKVVFVKTPEFSSRVVSECVNSSVENMHRRSEGTVEENFNSSNYEGEDEEFVLLEENDNWSQVALRKTLELVAEKGADALYQHLAKNLSEDVIRAGGILTADDLRNYQVIRRTPIHFEYNGLDLISVPPPSSGGPTLGLILNILQLAKMNTLGRNGRSYHFLTEALKFAFGERMLLGDPAFVNGTDEQVEKMLSESLANDLFSRIVEQKTFAPSHYITSQRTINEDHGTTHLSVVDEEGNAVAITSTVNLPFGARFVSSSTGILLNNEMDDFSTGNRENSFGLAPAEANEVEPGKRPLSSMSPLIVLKNGRLYMVLGGSGGPRIITSVAQVFLNIATFGDDPAKAIAAPRLHHQLFPNTVFLESLNSSSCELTDTFSTSLSNKPDWSYWSDVCQDLKDAGHNITVSLCSSFLLF
ncbi:gamma-glutamyltranspeptidase isoform 1 [Galdieria sulphuraria]|uniref:Gamma-glutamyltranspeptidase isoform 1 n=1 Tax=Galdieria sulphuraria TaxID=130081 RepID=M2W914_GALSU|nr:gamma-glutamyltranspeptidase isoform 1 [Galdieria sulphuraria]EME32336.1 gamma-glutamyltranspeptidase isoform 1 [Galdieria sulphuraria]|eukprot:XP_005708856.1 gamma-glutamyltranspeptidase isoform 1 [Galdieria sulphuraria]